MSQSTPTTAVDEFADHTKTPMQRVQSTLHKYPWVSPFVVLALLVVIFTVLVFVTTDFSSAMGAMVEDEIQSSRSYSFWR